MRRFHIYALLLLSIPVIIFLISYGRNEIRKRSIQPENLITVRMHKVNCDRKSNIVFTHQGSNHILNVTYPVCMQLKVGDSIDVYYNARESWYFLQHDGKEEEDASTMIGAAIIFIAGSACYVVLLFRRKKRDKAV